MNIITEVSERIAYKNIENFASIDKLNLLTLKEIYINWSYDVGTAKNLTKTLDYYIAQGATKSNYSETIKKDGTGVSEWWLRRTILIRTLMVPSILFEMMTTSLLPVLIIHMALCYPST